MLKTQNKRVSHGANNGNAIAFPRQRVAGGGASTDVARPCRLHPRIDPLRAPEGKIHHGSPLSRMDTPCSLTGNQGLQVDLIDDKGLNELCLNKGCGNLEDGFVLEEKSALWNGPDLACEA